MKVDKRLSEEFGTELPPVTPRWKALGPFVLDALFSLPLYRQIMIGAGLLGAGGLAEHFLPGIRLWFMVVCGVAFLAIVAIAALVLFANAADWPEHDGDYPGS